MSVQVTQLHVYPVKSCAGTALDTAEIGPRGILHDREFMVVDSNGDALTQRELPRLALIQPVLANHELRLRAPGMADFSLAVPADGQRRTVRIFSRATTAADQGDAAADWLSVYLDAACRLVRMPDDVVRLLDPEYAVRPTDQVAFADGYPVLLIAQESLGDLNARLSEPLPMNRFRPNVVITGQAAAYDEDTWAEIDIGEVRFSLVKACARCVITTTDQLTAERGAEPLATLATYRRIPRGVLFGQNLIASTSGTVRIGDAVRIIARRREPATIPFMGSLTPSG